jgi:HPt (histidine-containing phosphotransfer) domain-containing protein
MTKIDLSYIESIAAGDKVFVKEMLQMFNKSTYPEINNIEKQLSLKEWDLVAKLAHKIKAPIQILGQVETYDLVVIIEKSARDKANLEQINDQFAILKTKMNEIKDEVKKIIDSM